MSTEISGQNSSEAEAALRRPPRACAQTLNALAPVVLWGFLALAVLGCLENAVVLIESVNLGPGAKTQYLGAALDNLISYGLTGIVVSLLMKALARLLQTQTDQAARTDEFLRRELLPVLNRLADALDRSGPTLPGAAGAEDEIAGALAAIREAIEAARWAEADTLLRGFADRRPEHPAGARLADELTQARATATDDLIARIAAARGVNDPDRVLELRGALTPLLHGESRRALDRDLAPWFMAVIQRRLRSGTVRADLVALITRVAEQLDETAEGASLRAALPTLRRSVGLCARCAQPYAGIEDACPQCLGTGSPLPAFPPPANGNGAGSIG